MSFYPNTQSRALTGLTERIRYERMRVGWTQKELAERARVPVTAVKRPASTGECSLLQLFRIAAVMGRSSEFDKLFQIDPKSIGEKKHLMQKKRVRKSTKHKTVSITGKGKIELKGRVSISRKTAV